MNEKMTSGGPEKRGDGGGLGEKLKRSFVKSRWSWMGVSLGIHLLLLLVMARVLMPLEFEERIYVVLGTFQEQANRDEPLEMFLIPETLDAGKFDANPLSAVASEMVDSASLMEPPAMGLVVEDPVIEAPDSVARFDVATSGRTQAGRRQLVEQFGGTEASEAAVNRGLEWLARVQRPGGDWSFREVGSAGGGGSVSAGTEMGATAVALLCFLGAGHTHKDPGPYQGVVARGFEALRAGGKPVRGQGYDYRGPIPNDHHGSMYIHGLVTIAFAEGYGMTRDRLLGRSMENAARFIVMSQDFEKGGWRYTPGKDSDTSVLGWQVMALKSAQRGKMRVPATTFVGVSRFLERVAVDGGARYGYTSPDGGRPSTTAIGLLCQMYLGWNREQPALERGVGYLASTGPDFNDFYYLYYATQVMHHWGGEEWETWNRSVRDGLVSRQVLTGDGAGSWNPTGSISGRSGGRLFDTCLAIMTLEVYYRYLPLYERTEITVKLDDR